MDVDQPRLLPSVLVPEHAGSKRTTRDWIVDVMCFLAAVVLGAIAFATSHDDTAQHVRDYADWFVMWDVVAGIAACGAVWLRRRWPLGLAISLTLLAVVSSAASGAAAVALFTLAVHRPFRQAAPVAALGLATLPVVLEIFPGDEQYVVNLVLSVLVIVAVLAWGMFVRARRQLVFSLRERAQRAETEQQLRVEQARQQERARIAREMHDVLAHRISLMALHAGGLEVRPDLPPARVRETAELLRSTARQALEELRGVIGVLREEPGQEPRTPVRLPTLSDIRRLVDECRQAGAPIDLEMRVEHADAAPSSLGRDAYRIVQEALTNIRKHAGETTARVRITGAPGNGLHISIRNRQQTTVPTAPTLPGSGAGLLGLQERVTLAGGTLVHGADGSGDFVVEAELQW